jgi:ABC-type glycerol-3-phosphate transport system permease component
MSYRATALLRQILTYTLLLIFGLAFILPFWWMLVSSLKEPGAGMKFPPQFFPKVLIWSNYPKVFELIPLLTFFKNSLIITSLSLLGELFSASLVAFAFARLRFPGRNFLFGLVLATMMIPYPVTMVPTFVL